MWGQKSLPYSYGFENNNLAAEGWTILDSISNTAIVKIGTYGVQVMTGDYSFRFNSGYNKTEYLVSPLLESSKTGIELSFYYKNAATSSKETFYVGYSTTEGEGEPQTSSFTWLSDALVPSASMSDFQKYNVTLNDANIKYVAIKHVSANSHNVFIDDVTIDPAETYKRPKALNVSSYTSSTATLSWTNGDNETAWQIAYSTDPDFTPGTDGTTLTISANPYTLSNLTTGITYYAAIRADYGNGNYSEWTEKVAFTPNDEVEILLFDGTTQSYNIPISSSNIANPTALTQTQFIIPSSDLTNIQNRQITKLIFYSSRNSVTWGAATFEVYMKETNKTSFSTSTKEFESWGTCVYNNQGLSTNSSNGQMEITLNTPFNYTTGNLMIGFKQLTKGTTPSLTYWYSTQQNSNNAIYSYGTNVGVLTYSPKVTLLTVASTTAPIKIDDNGYTTFASTYPLDLADLPSGLKAYKAAVNGEKVNFTEINQAVPANTGVLLAGAAGATYFIPVADSGTAPEGNEFFVNSTGGTFTAESGKTYYGMLKNSDPLTFGTFDPSSVAIPSNKAYLKVSSNAARVLTSSFFDETTTGIMETRTESIDRLTTTKVFNLAGQQIANPTKGLYIINGKKHIIK